MSGGFLFVCLFVSVNYHLGETFGCDIVLRNESQPLLKDFLDTVCDLLQICIDILSSCCVESFR